MKEKMILFLRHDIFKVFSLNFLSTLIKIFMGFISVKIISVLIGPAGIALLGQLNNFTAVILTLCTGGIHLGITKYIAEYKNDKGQSNRVINTGISVTLFFTIIISLLVLLLSDFISLRIFGSTKYSSLISIFSFTLIFYSINSLILSIINGYKEFEKFVKINIFGNIFGVIVTICLAYYYSVYGALLGAIISQSLMFVITIFFIRSSKWLVLKEIYLKVDKPILKKLLVFSLMAVVTAGSIPVVQIMIRDLLIQRLSLHDAGIWEGMNRISAMYLMIITSSLSIYYLPRLAEIHNSSELKKEIFFVSRVVIPLVFVGSFLLFSLRDFIINLIFTPDFHGMRNLFRFQLVGDFFKICSWIVGYQLIAKSRIKLFVFNEIFFSILLYILSYYLIDTFGIGGASSAYAVTYFFNFLFMLVILKRI